MTKKKMCPWHKRAACSVDHTEYNYDKYKYVRHACPKNVNDKCEIVEKDVVIKAWVRNHNGIDGGFAVSPIIDGPHFVPCTIHIKASDYKKLKRDK